jgi:hypothetical protein
MPTAADSPRITVKFEPLCCQRAFSPVCGFSITTWKSAHAVFAGCLRKFRKHTRWDRQFEGISRQRFSVPEEVASLVREERF